MKIALASDHGGVELKNEIYKYLSEKNIDALDLSPKNISTDDYPDFAYLVGKSIQDKKANLGILVCRSGIGISIAANKMQGIYCGRIVKPLDAVHASHDNGINVISLSGDDMTLKEAKEAVDNFINSEKLNDQRHIRRYNKVLAIENGTYNEL